MRSPKGAWRSGTNRSTHPACLDQNSDVWSSSQQSLTIYANFLTKTATAENGSNLEVITQTSEECLIVCVLFNGGERSGGLECLFNRPSRPPLRSSSHTISHCSASHEARWTNVLNHSLEDVLLLQFWWLHDLFLSFQPCPPSGTDVGSVRNVPIKMKSCYDVLIPAALWCVIESQSWKGPSRSSSPTPADSTPNRHLLWRVNRLERSTVLSTAQVISVLPDLVLPDPELKSLPTSVYHSSG